MKKTESFLDVYISNLLIEYNKTYLKRAVDGLSNGIILIIPVRRITSITSYPFKRINNLLSKLYFQPEYCKKLENFLDKTIPQYYGGLKISEWPVKSTATIKKPNSIIEKVLSLLYYPYYRFRYSYDQYEIEKLEENILTAIKKNRKNFPELSGEIIDIRNVQAGDVKQRTVELDCQIQTLQDENLRKYLASFIFKLGSHKLNDGKFQEV